MTLTLFGTDYASIILSDKIRVSSNDKLILSATNEISIGQTKISETNDNGVALTCTNETRHIGIHATELLSMIVLNMGTGIEMAEGVIINSKGSTSFECNFKKVYGDILVDNDLTLVDEVKEKEAKEEEESAPMPKEW